MTRSEMAYHLAERRCRQWNKLRTVETAPLAVYVWVKYHPVTSRPEFEAYQTSSEAWPLMSGEAVVRLDGKSGAVSLDALEICTAEEAAEASCA